MRPRWESAFAAPRLRRDSLRSLACLAEARWRSQRAKAGEPNIRQLEPDWQMAQALGRLSTHCLNQRPTVTISRSDTAAAGYCSTTMLRPPMIC